MDTSQISAAENMMANLKMDDFKQIKGIGPAIEKRLQAAGITTYAQLADQTPDSLSAILKGLFGFTETKIASQDWTGQALKLSAAHPDEEEPASIPVESPSSNRQHYQMFTIELLLDGSNRVRRTTVMHAETKEEQAWAGWNENRLFDFMRDRAKLRIEQPEPAAVKARQAQYMQDTGIRYHHTITGVLRITGIKPENQEMKQNIYFLPAGNAYDLCLDLDLEDISAPGLPVLEYHVTLYAHNLINGEQRMVGIAQGTTRPGEKTTARVESIPMESGTYRLEAMAVLTPPSEPYRPGNGLMAWAESNLFEIN